jgi:hypothetical protein
MKNWCWLLLIFIVAGSCLDNANCLRGADNALIIDFIKLSDGKRDTIALFNIQAEGSDSIFYASSGEPDKLDTLESSAIIAINPYENETLFTFVFEEEEKFLKVGYKSEVRFVSEECGSERLQYDLRIIETDFDSVRVIRRSLNKGRSTNIEIYN